MSSQEPGLCASTPVLSTHHFMHWVLTVGVCELSPNCWKSV